MATNVVRGHYRAGRRHDRALARLGLELELDVADFAEDVSGRVDDAARIAAMHRSLARLRGPERDVLALCAWSELSYAAAITLEAMAMSAAVTPPPAIGPDRWY